MPKCLMMTAGFWLLQPTKPLTCPREWPVPAERVAHCVQRGAVGSSNRHHACMCRWQRTPAASAFLKRSNHQAGARCTAASSKRNGHEQHHHQSHWTREGNRRLEGCCVQNTATTCAPWLSTSTASRSPRRTVKHLNVAGNGMAA